MTFPDAGTRLACVLGHPIGHSLSPAIHNAALRHEGRNGVFLAFDVRPDDLREAIEGLQRLGAAGCNLTVPHKRAGLKVATELSDAARRVGATNTLVFAGSEILGHNTDVAGVRRELAGHGVRVDGARCLVLGAGGAGRGAAFALAEAGAILQITNRTPERSAELTEAVGAAGYDAACIPWEDVPSHAGNVDVIVNATSVGLDGRSSPLPPEALEAASVGGCRFLLDLVYAPDETPLVRAARGLGLVAADGLGVLVHQAAEAYALFWGAEAPLDAMREAAWMAAGRGPGRYPGERASVPPIL